MFWQIYHYTVPYPKTKHTLPFLQSDNHQKSLKMERYPETFLNKELYFLYIGDVGNGLPESKKEIVKTKIVNGGQHGSIQTYERALEKTKDSDARTC